MSALASHLLTSDPNEHIQWTTDRGAATPAHFGDPREEYQNLSQSAALLDFSHCGCLEIAGEQRVDFLSGLITNQIRNVTPDRVIYAAILTPQGRFLWDFTIIDQNDRLLLATEPDRVAALTQRLSMYLLRTKATIGDVSGEYARLAVVGPRATEMLAVPFPDLPLANAPLGAMFNIEPDMKLWRDPRHDGFGWRLLMPRDRMVSYWEKLCEIVPAAGFEAWEGYRLERALPRGGSELVVESTIPLEAGFLEMNGVDFSKGCYVGQETIARTHHRGTLKKRLFQLRFSGSGEMAAGTRVLLEGGKEAGIISSASILNATGLGLLRLSDVASAKPLTADGRTVTPLKPDWATWA